MPSPNEAARARLDREWGRGQYRCLGGSWGSRLLRLPSGGAAVLGEGMRVEFTNNALARMLDRDIGQNDIRAALDTPDHLGPSFEKRWRARKMIGARTLEVVFWRHRAHTQVVTAYWQESSS